MKKALVLSFIVAYAFSTLEAQIEVVSDGTVRVGADNFDPGDNDFTVVDVQHNTVGNNDAYTSMRMDNVNNFLILNNKGTSYRNEIIWKTANIVKWYLGMMDSNEVGGYPTYSSFFIGKNLGGAYPYIWLDYGANNIGLFTSDPDLNFELTLMGNALSYGGSWQSSDIGLKQNINRIESSLEKLLSIRGVTYEYNSEYEKLVSPELIDNKEIITVDSTGATLNQKTELSSPIPKNKYGVLAQEVMVQFPDLVHKGSNGYYAVNYDGLIPVLIEAIKEQQTIIENIQNELIALNQSSLKSLISTTYDDEIVDSPKLYQNAPNPFNRESSIRYRLPASITYAILSVYDLRGKLLRSYKLDPSMGVESAIIITAGEFQPGMYLYSLIVDNRLIDTKEMVITE